MPAPHEASTDPVTSRRGFFWVGTERAAHPGGTIAAGPMYVEWEAPPRVRHPYPVVLVHGGGGQGLDWLGTPDGRPGWAPHLVAEGYAVYVVDRPGHGRAAYLPDVLGPMGGPPAYEMFEWLFAPPAEGAASHPAARLHTQWPGAGPGDEVFDALVACMGPMPRDMAAAQARDGRRLAELLERIGPSIVVTHSAGAPAGWLGADASPERVRAIVALEPIGPPFAHDEGLGVTLSWGPTAVPLTYDPPAADPSELRLATLPAPARGQPPLVLQEEPARRLARLAGIPIAVVAGEASRFVHFAPHLPAFLEQAGCDVELIRLADRGVRGNAHGLIFERNHREVLRVVLDWLDARGLSG